jgi:hypothetical protein
MLFFVSPKPKHVACCCPVATSILYINAFDSTTKITLNPLLQISVEKSLSCTIFDNIQPDIHALRAVPEHMKFRFNNVTTKRAIR